MSKIEVNTITQQCGPTLTVGGGACKSVTVDATTVTLGKSGGTVTLACGATQSGFGQTYSATAYCTTVKTAPFTAVAGKGYFVNTTCAAVTVTLPASPTAGDVVSLKDYAGTWQTNFLFLCNNGSKIGGICGPGSLYTEGQAISLIYVDAVEGWTYIGNSTGANIVGSNYIQAIGGTVTTCGDYKIHTFTSDDTFIVTNNAQCASYQKADYLVVAGGGSAGPLNQSGGGGAGGFRESKCATTSGCWTASPLASATSIPISIQSYPITVGAGGAGSPTGSGTPGSNSIFSTITSAGGGRGGRSGQCTMESGGSGGGGGEGKPGAAGNTPPVSPPQGQPGGNSTGGSGGGGGGAIAGGCSTNNCNGGAGGAGVSSSITGTPTAYAGGGGGGANNGTGGSGGTGGGGPGGSFPSPATKEGNPGTANTGGGGGGGSVPAPLFSNGSGGSGIVIIRYKYQ
jgi:hypothetical protein